MSYKWRIYCKDPEDEGWQYQWSNTEITECPNNSLHEVNPYSISVVDTEKQILVVYPNIGNIKSFSFVNAAEIEYDTNSLGPLRKLTLLVDITGDITSFCIEICDKISGQTIHSENMNVISTNIESYTTGSILISTTGRVGIDINVKKNDGSKNSNINIKQIVIYSSKAI